MNANQQSYRGILKGTAIFGGVQGFNILISLIRGKLVAILLGTTGMGISALLTTTCNLIQLISSMGINMSAVRDLSSSNQNGTIEQTSKIVLTVRRFVSVSAIIGTLILICFSHLLSIITFGDTNYQIEFICLSVYVLLTTLLSGELCLLQGFRKLKLLSTCSIIGGACGLIVGVPLYYFWGTNGIVPGLIIQSIVSFIFVYYATKQITLVKIRMSWKESWHLGHQFLLLGLLMMFAYGFANLYQLGISSFIRTFGSLADVGLFQAANSITNQCVAPVYSAMTTDYYPQLAAVAHDKIKMHELVMNEAEIVILLIAPISIFLITLAPYIITLLLTDEFLPVTNIVRFMALSILLQAVYFPISNIATAKGDKKIFFLLEGVYANISAFGIYALFYYLFGFVGLGYGVLVRFTLGTFIEILVYGYRYNVWYNERYFILAGKIFFLVITCFSSTFILNKIISNSLMIISTCSLVLFCIYELDKRISFLELCRSKIFKKKNENR